jgi:hypothetical protein
MCFVPVRSNTGVEINFTFVVGTPVEQLTVSCGWLLAGGLEKQH